MSKYILRLDDAAEKMDVEKWHRMEQLLDKYNIKPLVGVIPDCKDRMMDEYQIDEKFWDKVKCWERKGWTIALHGYEHVYCTDNGGINPVNPRSEFAGVPLEEQKRKVREGIKIFKAHGINPKVFFAPSHTFDEKTIEAIKTESEIRIISDTIANKPYTKYGMTFVPQQSGRVRTLPFNTVTFCYHPNMMTEEDFDDLDTFINRHKKLFKYYHWIETKRKYTVIDNILNIIYMSRHKHL